MENPLRETENAVLRSKLLRQISDAVSGIRKLAEVDLWEVSLVTFPANQAANVTVIKQADRDTLTGFSCALDRMIGDLAGR